MLITLILKYNYKYTVKLFKLMSIKWSLLSKQKIKKLNLSTINKINLSAYKPTYIQNV